VNLTKVEAPNHTPDQVRAIIREAIEIADELDLQGHRWQPVFIQAAQLLGAKAVTFVAEQPIPAMAIPRNHGGR
jgi:hypothetical protein